MPARNCARSATPALSACPACQAAPAAERLAELRKPEMARLMLSLPTAHCAACISTVEHALAETPGVRSARVNLTLKRVSVEADPEVTADFLVDRLAGVGYEAHELDSGLLSATETDKQSRDLLMRLGVAFFATMNVMLLSVAVWSGAEAATRDMFHWISAMIALPTVVFSGQPFFRSAWRALRVGRLNMDVPISLALVLASGVSLFETAHSGQHAYFDAALMLTFFLLVGPLSRPADPGAGALGGGRTGRARGAEGDRDRGRGRELSGRSTRSRRANSVLVRPGGRMPVDGVVVEGSSEIDRGLLTGESLPVFAGVGMAVSAGEVNLTGPAGARRHRGGARVQPAPDGRSGRRRRDGEVALHLDRRQGEPDLRAGGAYPVAGRLRLVDVGDVAATCGCR